MNSFELRHRSLAPPSAIVGFHGTICLNMTDYQSLIKCVNDKSNLADSIRLSAFQLFLYQMQLLHFNNLTIHYYKSFSPANFSDPNHKSVLGAQFWNDIDYAMAQTVISYKRAQIVKFSTPFQFGFLCFYVRHPGFHTTTAISKRLQKSEF